VNPFTHCPINGRPFEDGWKYCPWHGRRIGTEFKPRDTSDWGPQETVVAFSEAYRRGDGATMAAVLDLETVLSDWITASLGRWEGLPEKIGTLMQEQAVPEMAEAMAPTVLRILTSPEIRTVYQPESMVTDNLLKFYYVREEGDRAWLHPRPGRWTSAAPFAPQTFRLRKKAGHWVITHMPFFEE
jgi:hypothetical protein